MERDPATPLEGALRAQRNFAGARLLTVVDEGGHAAYAIGENDCVDGAVEAFLLDGVLPDEGQTCPGKPIPPPVLVDDPRTLLAPTRWTACWSRSPAWWDWPVGCRSDLDRAMAASRRKDRGQ